MSHESTSGFLGTLGCALLFLAFIVIALIALAIWLAIAVLAGVGLWYLIRFIWRKYAAARPEAPAVQRGMKMTPLTRKVLAATPCVILGCCLFFAPFVADGDSDSADSPAQEGTQTSAPAAGESTQGMPATTPDSSAPHADDATQAPVTASAGTLEMHFIDVGQGDSELLQLPDGSTMLVDAGTADEGPVVVSYLKSQNVKTIDYLVATHPDADHIGGMEDVIQSFSIGELWMPDYAKDTKTFNGFVNAARAKDIPTKQAYAGETIVPASAGYEIDVLGPSRDLHSDDANDYSIVLKVVDGSTSALFTGDATADELVSYHPGHVDLLKAAHHGSRTGTTASVMNALTPQYVIMSYALGNSYGHPHQSALDAIEKSGARAYSTAANGTIVATSDGSAITISCPKNGQIVAGKKAAKK